MVSAQSAGLPPLLREVVSEQLGFLPSGQRVPLQSNVSLDEAEALYRLVRQQRPLHSMEIGLAQGVSTTAILQALQENGRGTHHVIDPFQHRYGDAGLALVDRAGLSERLDFHQRFPEEVIPHLPELEFAFIDSSHLFDLTVMEFVLTDKKLARDGLVAFHDLWMPSMQCVARYILTNRAYSKVEVNSEAVSPRRRARRYMARCLQTLPIASLFRTEVLAPDAFAGSNLLVLRKSKQDERDWRFHQNF